MVRWGTSSQVRALCRRRRPAANRHGRRLLATMLAPKSGRPGHPQSFRLGRNQTYLYLVRSLIQINERLTHRSDQALCLARGDHRGRLRRPLISIRGDVLRYSPAPKRHGRGAWLISSFTVLTDVTGGFPRMDAICRRDPGSARPLGVRQSVARVAIANPGSVRLHRSHRAPAASPIRRREDELGRGLNACDDWLTAGDLEQLVRPLAAARRRRARRRRPPGGPAAHLTARAADPPRPAVDPRRPHLASGGHQPFRDAPSAPSVTTDTTTDSPRALTAASRRHRFGRTRPRGHPPLPGTLLPPGRAHSLPLRR